MTSDDRVPDDIVDLPADLRIGTPERQRAVEALQAHLTARRLTVGEYEQRAEACDRAHTRSELLRIFHDLPEPHPELPPVAAPPAAPDDDLPPVALAGCLMLALGLPVAVVLGVVYEAWWTLAVPVVVTVMMAYGEQLRSRPRSSLHDGKPTASHPD